MTQRKDALQAGKDKQKKQLMVLGGLSLALVAVLAIQFGGGDAGAPGTVQPVASAQTAGATPAAAAPAATSSPTAKDKKEPSLPAPEANDALSADPSEEGLGDNPFKNFWSSTDVVEQKEQELPPPVITLNATMTGEDDQPVALIDGRLQYLGDVIQGWELAEVRTRSVVLRAPTQEWVVVDMPLLDGTIRLPGVKAAVTSDS